MDQTAFQRIFGTVADIDKQYNEMAMGIAPSDPFLWTAAWTRMDPTRAPEGKHTLIMDTFVPVDLASGEALGPDEGTGLYGDMARTRRSTAGHTQENRCRFRTPGR